MAKFVYYRSAVRHAVVDRRRRPSRQQLRSLAACGEPPQVNLDFAVTPPIDFTVEANLPACYNPAELIFSGR
jgi:hypothetical protein